MSLFKSAAFYNIFSKNYSRLYIYRVWSPSDNHHRAFSSLTMASAFIVASLHIITPAIAAAGPTKKVADTCHKISTAKLVRLLANHSVIRKVEPAVNTMSHFRNAATPSLIEFDGSKRDVGGIISFWTSVGLLKRGQTCATCK